MEREKKMGVLLIIRKFRSGILRSLVYSLFNARKVQFIIQSRRIGTCLTSQASTFSNRDAFLFHENM